MKEINEKHVVSIVNQNWNTAMWANKMVEDVIIANLPFRVCLFGRSTLLLPELNMSINVPDKLIARIRNSADIKYNRSKLNVNKDKIMGLVNHPENKDLDKKIKKNTGNHAIKSKLKIAELQYKNLIRLTEKLTGLTEHEINKMLNKNIKFE